MRWPACQKTTAPLGMRIVVTYAPPRSPHYALLSLFVHVPPLPLGFFDLLLVKERRFLLEALPPYLTLAGVGCAYVVFYLLFSVGMHRTNGGHHTYAFMEDLDALRPYPLGWLALALLASAGFAALTYVTWWTPQTQALDAKPPATAFPPSLAHSRAGAALLRGRGLPIALLANMRVLNCTSLDYYRRPATPRSASGEKPTSILSTAVFARTSGTLVAAAAASKQRRQLARERLPHSGQR